MSNQFEQPSVKKEENTEILTKKLLRELVDSGVAIYKKNVIYFSRLKI